MADYLKNFETTEEYEEYIDGDFLKPNVSYLIDNNQVRYNPVTPSGDGVLFANILTTQMMAATYQGKLVYGAGTSEPQSLVVTQEALDEYIANEVLWGAVSVENGPPLSWLRKEDGQPVTDADVIPVSSVPADADLFISAGEGYYIQNQNIHV